MGIPGRGRCDVGSPRPASQPASHRERSAERSNLRDSLVGGCLVRLLLVLTVCGAVVLSLRRRRLPAADRTRVCTGGSKLPRAVGGGRKDVVIPAYCNGFQRQGRNSKASCPRQRQWQRTSSLPARPGGKCERGATAPLSQSNSSNRESRRDLRFPARSAGRSADGALRFIKP